MTTIFDPYSDADVIRVGTRLRDAADPTPGPPAIDFGPRRRRVPIATLQTILGVSHDDVLAAVDAREIVGTVIEWSNGAVVDMTVNEFVRIESEAGLLL
jgi:hypothetical protein